VPEVYISEESPTSTHLHAPANVDYLGQWMDQYETQATHNLAETCCASISLDQLCALSEDKNVPMLNFSQKMTYGEIAGLKQLRVNLATFYSSKAGE
jgi:hypothetical protein